MSAEPYPVAVTVEVTAVAAELDGNRSTALRMLAALSPAERREFKRHLDALSRACDLPYTTDHAPH